MLLQRYISTTLETSQLPEKNKTTLSLNVSKTVHLGGCGQHGMPHLHVYATPSFTCLTNKIVLNTYYVLSHDLTGWEKRYFHHLFQFLVTHSLTESAQQYYEFHVYTM